MKKLIMNVATNEKRIAVLEKGKVTELKIQQPNQIDITGNIYKGRVINVLPGMQAAFVDIGVAKNGFIHRDQLKSYQLCSDEDKKTKTISHFVHQGEEILVQVVKEGVGGKGPKLTGMIEIPGQFVIYLPYGDYIAVSRKMQSTEQEKWRTFLSNIKQNHEGFIIRTASERENEDVVLREIDILRKKYNHLVKRAHSQKTPSIFFEANDIVERMINEIPSHDLTEIVVDDLETYKTLTPLKEIGQLTLSLYSGKENIFTYELVDKELEKALKKIVWLDNGAYIIIERTEAMTIIDVNTGKYKGKASYRETVLKTNELAAIEILRQLRLRDIGGMVLIDFIEMPNEKDKQRILSVLNQQAKLDRVRIMIFGFTQLGIVELTRKKVRQSIDETLMEQCQTCLGTGVVKTAETIAFQLERELWELRSMTEEAVWIEARKDVKELYYADSSFHIKRLEEVLQFSIFITECEEKNIDYRVKQIGSRNELESKLQSFR
ncbi:ribonuclease E/G [Bacillus timonensis]|nr:ribonuclease E/G [Bacillus timonensis]